MGLKNRPLHTVIQKFSLFFLLSLFVSGVHAQKQWIRKLLSNEKDTTRKVSFMPVPAFGYKQETGFEFGAGALYSFYYDRIDLHNRSSNLSGVLTYSTKKTYNFSLKGDMWTKANRYHLLTEIRFRKMPFNFYGIGNQTLKADEDKLTQRQLKLAFDLEKLTFRAGYTGISLGYEHFNFIDHEAGGLFSSSPALHQRAGGGVWYSGLSQSYDTRNSNNYPTRGFFGRLSVQYVAAQDGQNSFDGALIKLNLRNFWSVTPKIVIGIQGIYHTIQGHSVPFYLLPQLGNDEVMRGYYTGRYRDQHFITAQTELRYRFMNRFGIVAFAGTGKVAGNHNFSFRQLKPNYGLGGRYFFDTAKGLSVRLDYGIGEKLKYEERQKGWYVSLAEAF
ncbi:hypothetical protein D9M68_523200 [compost metagenome]